MVQEKSKGLIILSAGSCSSLQGVSNRITCPLKQFQFTAHWVSFCKADHQLEKKVKLCNPNQHFYTSMAGQTKTQSTKIYRETDFAPFTDMSSYIFCNVVPICQLPLRTFRFDENYLNWLMLATYPNPSCPHQPYVLNTLLQYIAADIFYS